MIQIRESNKVVDGYISITINLNSRWGVVEVCLKTSSDKEAEKCFEIVRNQNTRKES